MYEEEINHLSSELLEVQQLLKSNPDPKTLLKGQIRLYHLTKALNYYKLKKKSYEQRKG